MSHHSTTSLRRAAAASAARSRHVDDDDDNDNDDDVHNNNSNSNIAAAMSRTTTTRTSLRSNLPSLVCAFSASATTGGTTYAFGLYAAALKKALELDQGEMDSISTAFFLAGLFSWIPGLLVDRCGTKVALVTGGGLGASAIMGYWAVAKQQALLPFLMWTIPHAWLVPVLSTLGILIFLSCGMITGAVFKIIVSSTGPGSKGSAVGAAKGYVGLGAGLYACLFGAVQTPGESELDFLPMAAWFFIACAAVPALCLLPSKREMDQCTFVDDSTSLHFRTLYISLTVLATVIVLTGMMDLYQSNTSSSSSSVTDPDTTEPYYGRAFLLVAIWLAPIHSLQYLPRGGDNNSSNATTNATIASPHVPLPTVDDDDDNDDDNMATEQRPSLRLDDDARRGRTVTKTGEATTELPLAADIENLEGEVLLSNAAVASTRRIAAAGHDSSAHLDEDGPHNMNLVQMLRTPSAWLMLWTATILVGAGTVVTTHMGQMVQSLGFANSVTSAAMAFFSVAQAASRVATGSISEAAVKYVSRPTFLVLASIVGCLAHLLLGFAQSEVVFVAGVTLSGAAFGMVWPLLVLITGEVFGTAHVGANYMFYDGFTAAVGTLLMTKLIAQDVYESHISPKADDPTTCLGMGCFQQTHLAMAGLSMTCIVTSWMMLITTREVYRRNRQY
jgi:MFS family permease